jgi:hypothetical protein
MQTRLNLLAFYGVPRIIGLPVQPSPIIVIFISHELQVKTPQAWCSSEERTRTAELRVMSPTRYQLLHLAV